MATMTAETRLPNVVRILALLGAAWNVFGIVQWSGQVFATPTMLMAKGMTPAQATLYAALPVWMTIVFAIGVFGGLIGSLLLLIGRRAAITVLGISLIGYVILYIGDITQGVFAAFGTPQVVVLSLVVAIAVGLLALAVRADRRGSLR